MTRLTTPQLHTQKPDSVAISELAIAAGVIGRSIAVCLTESPAEVDCELWRYLARRVDPGRTLHIHGQEEVRRLGKSLRHWRIIVVHASRLFEKVSWIIQSQTLNDTTRPAIILRCIPDGCRALQNCQSCTNTEFIAAKFRHAPAIFLAYFHDSWLNYRIWPRNSSNSGVSLNNSRFRVILR